MTNEERRARGRAARAEVPRSSHGAYAPSPVRIDPVALLEKQAATRLPELVAIRHGRMLASPFAFLRGAALGMAADLASTPSAGIRAQICGDAHLANFGAFGSPERRMIFDVNDFDESLPGPWEWDLKRLVASLAVAGRDNAYSAADRTSIVTAAAAQYRIAMAQFARMPTIDVWYAHVDVEELLLQVKTQMSARQFSQLTRSLANARRRGSLQAFSKLTRLVDGIPRIVSDPPLIVPLSELYPKVEADKVRRSLLSVIAGYRATLSNDRQHLLEGYRFVELARKVVGVGSEAWIVLFLGVTAPTLCSSRPRRHKRRSSSRSLVPASTATTANELSAASG